MRNGKPGGGIAAAGLPGGNGLAGGAGLPGGNGLVGGAGLPGGVGLADGASGDGAAVAAIGASAVLSDVNWITVVSTAVLAGVLSLLTSVAGLPEVKAESEISSGK